MALLRFDTQTTQRHTIKRGPFSADIFNDTIDELVTDFVFLAKEWNTKIIPLMTKVPDGTQDALVNAFTNALDGRTLYVDWSADTSPQKIRFYNQGRSRPKTIKEALDDLYSSLSNLGDVFNTTIISGGLTDAQKAAIGIHIFDTAQTSSSTSLDGLTHSNALNIQQIARDLYGSTWVLNGDGNPILTNSVQAMVNALLVLHDGHWSDDITLNPDASGGGGGGGGGGTLATDYAAGSSSADQTIALTNADGGPIIINGTITSGILSGTDTFKILNGNTTVSGTQHTGIYLFKNDTPLSAGLTNNSHLSILEQSVPNNTFKDLIQLQVSPFSAGASAAGMGLGIGFGGVTSSGVSGGYTAYGRSGYVVIDPVGATFTSGAVIAVKGNNKSVPAWDDGAEVIIQTSGTTTNATPLAIITIPIANSPIHIFQGTIQINATTADGLNFKTWKYDFALSTSLGSTNLSIVPGVFFDAGTTTGWSNAISFSSGNLNILSTGATSTTIKWRVMLKLFGVNAAN